MKKLEMPRGWDKKDPAVKIAWSNFTCAVDESETREDYNSLIECMGSYSRNASDTAIEQGFDGEVAGNASLLFWELYRHNF